MLYMILPSHKVQSWGITLRVFSDTLVVWNGFSKHTHLAYSRNKFCSKNFLYLPKKQFFKRKKFSCLLERISYTKPKKTILHLRWKNLSLTNWKNFWYIAEKVIKEKIVIITGKSNFPSEKFFHTCPKN